MICNIYNENNLDECIEMISIEGKTNFFEKFVIEYSKAGMGVNNENMTFTMDTDF